MEIRVADIPAEGLKVELSVEARNITGLGEDIKVPGPVKAAVSLRKVGATVYLAGKLEGLLELLCSRCGKAFQYPVKSVFKLDLNPLEGATEEEKELQSGDLEVDFYKNGTVELDEFVREQLLLQAPMKPLCREDCPGLCQYCGQDKSLADCGCQPPAGHPGLMGLKDLLKKKE